MKSETLRNVLWITLAGIFFSSALLLFVLCYLNPPYPKSTAPRLSPSEYLQRLTRLGVEFGPEGDFDILIYRGDIILGQLRPEYLVHTSDQWTWRFGEFGRQVPRQMRDRISKALHYTFPENTRQDVSVLSDFLRVLEEALVSAKQDSVTGEP
jgi:hypothetical protein